MKKNPDQLIFLSIPIFKKPFSIDTKQTKCILKQINQASLTCKHSYIGNFIFQGEDFIK